MYYKHSIAKTQCSKSVYTKWSISSNHYSVYSGFLKQFPKFSDMCFADCIEKHRLGLAGCFAHIFYHIHAILSPDTYSIDHYDIIFQSLMSIYYILIPCFNALFLRHIQLLEIEKCTKSFLSNVLFKKYSCFFTDDMNTIWQKQGNFLSLLNLFDNIKLFRSIR